MDADPMVCSPKMASNGHRKKDYDDHPMDLGLSKIGKPTSVVPYPVGPQNWTQLFGSSGQPVRTLADPLAAPWGCNANIYPLSDPNVGNYSSTMEHMGMDVYFNQPSMVGPATTEPLREFAKLTGNSTFFQHQINYTNYTIIP